MKRRHLITFIATFGLIAAPPLQSCVRFPKGFSILLQLEKEFKGWSSDQRLAFLINLYNAATLRLVTDHYPVKSIKDIGGFFSG